MTEIKRPQEADKKTEMSTGGGVLPDVKASTKIRIPRITVRATGKVLEV